MKMTCVADLRSHPNRLTGMRPILKRATIRNLWDVPQDRFYHSETIVVRIEFAASEPMAGVGFAIYSAMGMRVGGFNTYMSSPPPHRLPAAGRATFKFSAGLFTPGNYYLNVSIGAHQSHLSDR